MMRVLEKRVCTDYIVGIYNGYQFKIDVKKLIFVLRNIIIQRPHHKRIDKVIKAMEVSSVKIEFEEAMFIPGILGTRVEITGLYETRQYHIALSLRRLSSSNEPHFWFAYVLAHELWHWIQDLVPGNANWFSEISFAIQEIFEVLVKVILFLLVTCVGTVLFGRFKWSYPLRSWIDRTFVLFLYVYLSPSEKEAYRFADKVMQGSLGSDWKDVVSIEKIPARVAETDSASGFHCYPR